MSTSGSPEQGHEAIHEHQVCCDTADPLRVGIRVRIVTDVEGRISHRIGHKWFLEGHSDWFTAEELQPITQPPAVNTEDEEVIEGHREGHEPMCRQGNCTCSYSVPQSTVTDTTDMHRLGCPARTPCQCVLIRATRDDTLTEVWRRIDLNASYFTKSGRRAITFNDLRVFLTALRTPTEQIEEKDATNE